VSVQRPVIPGFHPDPSICRVGDTYYLVTSSFEYAPGVPLFRSADLRSWQQIGNVLDRPSQLDVSKAGPSGGIFAPTLRYHDGRFWMITTNWSDDGGQLLVRAEDPAGPWSKPVRIPSAVGIDPDLAWADDDTCLMSYTAPASDEVPSGIRHLAIDPLTGEVLSEPKWLWAGTGGKFPEGPHLYRIGEWWYLLIAEGGTERGHSVTIARGPSPSGPFESNPANPILTHRGTDEPVQNTGHADLIQRPDGTWVIVYHGVRPRGSSPEWHVLGRETFADEVVWQDGWPVLTGHIEPTAPVEVRESLTGPELPPSWVAASRFPTEIATWEDGGWRVSAAGDEPVFIGRRQEHLYARVRARLAAQGTGGLSIRIDPRHALYIECSAGGVQAVWAIGDVRHVLGERELPEDGELELRVVPDESHDIWTGRGPDVLVAGLVDGGEFIELGRLDGRYLSTEVAGGMTGRMVGVWCSEGSVLVRSFEYVGSDDPAGLGIST
jgi:xylan 1,4-beta-xylosidase